jgi:hypothetical protein
VVDTTEQQVTTAAAIMLTYCNKYNLLHSAEAVKDIYFLILQQMKEKENDRNS